MLESGIVVLDPVDRRRAQICSFLYASNIHVEAFESIGEYRQTPIRPSAFLVCDEDCILEDLIQLVAEMGLDRPVIAFSPAPELPKVVKAIAGGATNYLAYPFDAGAVEVLTFGEAPVLTSRFARIRRRIIGAQARLAVLTSREQEVLAGIAAGHSNKMIARNLCISHRTVEIHRSNLMIKLGVSSSADVVRIAVESDFAALIEPEPLRNAA